MDIATNTQIRAELDSLGLRWLDQISWNAPAAALFQEAILRGEGVVADGGALVVSTGAAYRAQSQ